MGGKSERIERICKGENLGIGYLLNVFVNLIVLISLILLNNTLAQSLYAIDTGHFYLPSPTQCLVCLGLLQGEESKIGAFSALTYSF